MFTLTATVVSTATGSVTNTATVTAPASTTDPSPANNSATDTDSIVGPRPTLTVLDPFNRANSNTLNNGVNWSQTVAGGAASLRVNTNQAFANSAGSAIWNAPVAGFAAKQAAAFTLANTIVNGNSLILKASGGLATLPQNYQRVRYDSSGTGQMIVETTTNFGFTFSTVGSFPATLANGDTVTALANADGSVDVWKTTGATTTYLGRSAAVTAGSPFLGGGRIGMQLASGSRVDNFAGGSVA